MIDKLYWFIGSEVAQPVAYQAPLSMGFYGVYWSGYWSGSWSGLPFPSPEDLPNPGIELGSPALQADSLPSEPLEKTKQVNSFTCPKPRSYSNLSYLKHC